MGSFYEISGRTIDTLASLKYDNCKSVLVSSEIFTCIKFVECKLNDVTGEEVAVFDFYPDEHQNTIHDIRDIERIAISFKSDKELPKVSALRMDFPNDLSHLNTSSPHSPRELCVYEDHWEELKHKWSASTFLLRIKEWLELSAIGTLHQEDQPLEPFLNTNSILIYGQNINETFFVKELAKDTYELTSEPQRNGNYAISISSIETEHGIIYGEPPSVGELLDILPDELDFMSSIHKLIGEVLNVNAEKRQKFLNQKIILILQVKLKRRTDTKSEKITLYGFIIDEVLASLGLKTEFLTENKTKPGELIPNVLLFGENNFLVDKIRDVPIKCVNMIPKFDIERVALFSGKIDCNEYTFSLTGCGALGSQMLLNMARQGFGRWNLIDYDTLLPHNLTKHILFNKQVGLPKATSIKHVINQELFDNEDFILKCFERKIESAKSDVDLHQSLDNSDVIIDISTSISAQRFLTNTYPQKRKFSSFLNPKGNNLVFFAEDKENQKSLDLLEYQYYKELLSNENLEKHLELNESRIRYARGCRDISSTISQDNLGIFSGILSKKIKSQTKSENANISIWQLNDDLSVNFHNFDIDEWKEVKINGWTLYLNSKLLDTIRNFRISKLPNETGGIILGGVDKFYKKIFLVDSILSPIDSVEKRTLYIRGIKEVESKLVNISSITNNSIYYMGEWHSHPKGCSVNMSNDDDKLFSELVNESLFRGEPACMMILGDNELNIITSFTAIDGKQNGKFTKKIIL